MRIGYIGVTSPRTVIEHSHNITLGINEDTDAVLVEDPRIDPPSDLLSINTCFGVRTLLASDELQDNFRHVHSMKDGQPVVFIYGFVSPSGLSEMIEMTYSSRFLAGDVGPSVGFTKGTALKCTENLNYALPQLAEIVDSLKTLRYCGEITFGVTNDYNICSLEFGHFTMGFALYKELAKCGVEETYAWCLGQGNGGMLHNTGIATTTLLSYPPFPYSTDQAFSIRAPVGAEKHLYRMNVGECEVAYVSTWGESIQEAKRRARATIDKCRDYNKDIQYRIDIGHQERFLINRDKWLKFGGVEPKR
jgi:hypothetical protein